MQDVVTSETAKAQAQADAIYVGACQTWEQKRDKIVTALLEAKADVLAEVAYTGFEFPEEGELRQEVLNRRQKGL